MRLNTVFIIVSLCLGAAADLQAQIMPTNGPVRKMSLTECVRSAIEKNISIQIGDKVNLGGTVADLDVTSGGRTGLETARLNVHQSYAYYDPHLASQVGQNFVSTPKFFSGDVGLEIGARELWHENFAVDLGGMLPTGARYDLTANGSRLSGTTFDSTGNATSVPFQYGGGTAITLTQPLLRDAWIDAGRLAIKLSKQTVKMSEFSYQLLVMDIVRRVAQGYYDLVATRDQVVVQQQALRLARQLVLENNEKVKVGTLPPLDARQAESQAAKAEADLTSSVYNRQKAENVLKALISYDFSEIQPVTIEPTDQLMALYQSFSLPESWRTGLEKRPDYLLEKQQVEYQNIVLQYRRNQLYPGLDLQGTYGRNAFGFTTEQWSDSMQDNTFPQYGGAVILHFPLTFRSDRDAYKKAKIAKEALVLSLKRREDLVFQDIDDALKAVIATYGQTKARRDARIFAEAALDAEQKKLEQGKSTSFNVLQFQKDLTDAASLEITALADYNKALQQLYFSEGTTLERHSVTIELK